MAGDLAGKVVIITGGPNGIGRATAERCVAEAARVSSPTSTRAPARRSPGDMVARRVIEWNA